MLGNENMQRKIREYVEIWMSRGYPNGIPDEADPVLGNKDLSNRMASTIRHNRARGSHSIELMSNIVAELTAAGMSDAWILRHIGMDKDELLRLKQITGIAALFKDQEFSTSWSDETEIGDIPEFEDEQRLEDELEENV